MRLAWRNSILLPLVPSVHVSNLAAVQCTSVQPNVLHASRVKNDSSLCTHLVLRKGVFCAVSVNFF